ncbi:putative histidine kinase-like protein HHK3p [Paraphaeosphaeria sporulosa]|uniref:histidine kinase n=1 Tax=Paraphaeosphaeria sporulosa TaxID=1460663 RepID=A0A177CMQ4_9PLEO|nr:putative histidine kinase-like protein HHK3p [Paraphaeosphaeria sporulosa]OAG08541.1 putative histidine kinase-like protein HHK3p [Paraphaeosphaeria sporulosa]
MSSDAGSRASFFPKADAAVLRTSYEPPSPSTRPVEVGPILDPQNANKALDAWSAAITRDIYPSTTDIWGPAPIPDESLATTCIADRYLFPLLTRNERLRLTMLFYYTRGIVEDKELISRLQEKVHLARETVGWEFAITGLLDHNTYTRIVTVGLPLAVLPRRESTCAHTVNQPPGKIFNLANMAEDWRFMASPHVEQGGLRAYAGVPLRFETEFGQEQHVAFGSLCVASNTEQPPLTKAEQMSLARLADWIVADIVQSARARRQRERRTMMELLAVAQKQIDVDGNFEVVILDMLEKVYPKAVVSINTSIDDQLILDGGTEVPLKQIEQGLWEDGEYFDHLIEQSNHLDPVAPRIVRVVAVHCASQRIPTYLVVGSKDFRVVFDDVDSSFLHMAAEMLSRGWQNLALREALSAKDNFLRGITHQLRTPIHGILGSVELLAEELGTRETISQISGSRRGSTTSSLSGDHTDPDTYIRTIRSSAHDLISTVNSLINLNRWTDIAQAERIVAPHHIYEIETALLNEVLQPHLDEISKRPSIMFKHHFPEDFDTLALDMRLFVDCIQPLITNAIQAAEGGVVCVTTTVTDENAVLVVDIEDTGKGIPSSDHESIFRAYEKVNTHTTGAGLGLTVASRLASIMNGVVTLVRSEIGKGSHFRATFDRPAWLAAQRRTSITETVLLRFDGPMHPTPLSSFYVRYLLHRGHSLSENHDGSIYVFDHSTDFQHEQDLQSGRAGICLIPDSANHPLMHDGDQIRRDKNSIYVKGPFLSSILEQAWSQAYGIHVELEALRNASTTDVPPEDAIDDNEPVATSDDASGVPTTLSSTSLASGPTLLETADTLAMSLKSFHLKTPSPVLRRQPTKPTTLIVDDNAINLRFLEMYCRRRGIPHSTATDGLKAVRAFLDHQTAALAPDSVATAVAPIALILMDLQMPNCDGVEATRQIRKLEEANGWLKTTIVIVTGQDSFQDRTLSKEAGADDFFVKPVGPKVLDQGIKDWFPEAKV